MDVIGSIPVGPTRYTPLFRPLARSDGVFCACSLSATGVLRSGVIVRAGHIVIPRPYLSGMEHVVLKTTTSGMPTAVISNGRQWAVSAEPVRWFERVSWWEARRRMPRGSSRVDVEVMQLQVRLGHNPHSALTTMVLVRDGPAGSWRLRASMADAA